MAAQIVVITEAVRGFGRLSANAVAHGGHTVYAAMRETAGCNASQARDVADYAREEGVDLRTIDLDVASQASVDRAIAAIIVEHGRIDVLVHHADRAAFGPAEAFTPEQFAEFYDVTVLSTQRVNRAVLPHMRRRGRGLLVWVSSSSSAGGPALPVARLRGEGGAGCDRRAICTRAVTLGYRDIDRCARRLRPHPHRRTDGSGA